MTCGGAERRRPRCSAAWDLDAVRAAGAALAAILRDEIAGLASDGVMYVALENPLHAPLLTKTIGEVTL